MLPAYLSTQLPDHLEEARIKIEAIAEEMGLDFFETRFLMVDFDNLNEIAAYGGFPTRYPHWRHGMQFEGLIKGYEYGLSKIYELVINNDPCYAYLMRSNDDVSQKMVMAHVFGHCDFFKNNLAFSKTERNMMNQMANHASRIRSYVDRYGENRVERFIDACLSLENLIDPYLPFRGEPKKDEPVREDETTHIDIQKIEAKDYMDSYINPPQVLEQKLEQARVDHEKAKQAAIRFPEEPAKDVLLFLLNHAPLRRWQRDILSIIRDEAYYFAPQGMTKIMNEGWASYWHSRMMTERICDDSEIIDFAALHAGTMAMGRNQINPYKLGLELYRDIERRWNMGQHGPEWEACDDMERKANWDTGEMKGQQKIFEVRKLYDDIGFISEFLTPEFCAEQKLFTFEHNPRAGEYQIASRGFEQIKEKLLFQLTNMGQPVITVIDGNYQNRGELLLLHDHIGMDLDERYIDSTMKNLSLLWSRPVNLQTIQEEEEVIYSHDGESLTLRDKAMETAIEG